MLWPNATSMPFAYAIVRVGAFLAGATQAPLMAILMIFEMTLSYSVVLPLMLACVAAYFMARSVGKHSMYEVKPTAAAVVRASASFAEIERIFLEHPVRYVYVVDDVQRFPGANSLHEIKQHLIGRGAAPVSTAGGLMKRDFPVVLPDASLGNALQVFLTQGTERLPVVSSAGARHLLGVVSRSERLLQIQQLAS